MQSSDLSTQQATAKLPTGLNILTILTFIGCVIQIISAGYAFYMFHSGFMEIKNSGAITENAFRIKDKFFEGGLALHASSIYNSQVIVLTIALLCAFICFVGAMQMRKLRKKGLWLYLAGELLYPVIGSIFIFKYFETGVVDYIRLIIPVVFVGLYLSYSKYLIN